MKEYKLIRISEAHERVLTNGNWHFAEDYPWTEKMLNLHLRQGYTVKQMIATVSPADPGNDGYPFYKDGFIFLMEHDTEQGEVTAEDWEEANVLTEQDISFLEERRNAERRAMQTSEYEKYLREALEQVDEEEECFFS